MELLGENFRAALRQTPLQVITMPVGDAIDFVLTHHGLGDEAPNYLTGRHTHLRYLEGQLPGRPRSVDIFWSSYGLPSEI